VLLSQVGELVHQLAPVRWGQAFPRGMLQGLACGGHSDIDILGARRIYGYNLRLVSRDGKGRALDTDGASQTAALTRTWD
jgi:hypothetical protein